MTYSLEVPIEKQFEKKTVKNLRIQHYKPDSIQKNKIEFFLRPF